MNSLPQLLQLPLNIHPKISSYLNIFDVVQLLRVSRNILNYIINYMPHLITSNELFLIIKNNMICAIVPGRCYRNQGYLIALQSIKCEFEELILRRLLSRLLAIQIYNIGGLKLTFMPIVESVLKIFLDFILKNVDIDMISFLDFDGLCIITNENICHGLFIANDCNILLKFITQCRNLNFVNLNIRNDMDECMFNKIMNLASTRALNILYINCQNGHISNKWGRMTNNLAVWINDYQAKNAEIKPTTLIMSNILVNGMDNLTDLQMKTGISTIIATPTEEWALSEIGYPKGTQDNGSFRSTILKYKYDQNYKEIDDLLLDMYIQISNQTSVQNYF